MNDFSTLKTNIDKFLADIEAEKDFRLEQLHEKTVHAYHQHVAHQVASIDFKKQPAEIGSALQDFLSNNWKLIAGSLLCYTAIPDDPVSILCVHIAETLYKEYQSTILPIHYVMPGLCLESMYDNYPNLDTPELPLATIIRTHILDEFQHGLIPVTTLNLLASNIADNSVSTLPRIYYDMNTDLTHDGETALLTSQEMKRLIAHSPLTTALYNTWDRYKTILQDKGHLYGLLCHLIKHMTLNSTAGIGGEERAGEGAYEALAFFSTQYKKFGPKKDAMPTAIRAEISLLLKLAAGTVGQAPADIYTDFSEQDKQMVLVLLQLLIAPESLTTTTKKLLDTYTKLEIQENLKRKIAEFVAKHQKYGITSIDKETLERHLNSDSPWKEAITGAIEIIAYLKNQTTDRTSILSTCLNTRRQSLAAKMQGHESALSNITPDAGQVASEKTSLEQALKSQKTALLDAVTSFSPTAAGSTNWAYDTLGLTQHILQTLGVDFSFNDWKEGQEILSMLSPSEIAALFTDDVSREFIRQVATIENFIMLVVELSPNRLTALLDKMAILSTVSDSLLQSPRRLSMLLSVLPIEKTQIILNAGDRFLISIINSVNDFETVLRQLTPEQCHAVCDAMRARLPHIIITADEFKTVLIQLTPEQCHAVCDAMQALLPNIIQTSFNFYPVLRQLTPEQCHAVCDAMRALLSNIIETDFEFRIVLSGLTTEQCRAVCDAMQALLPNIIKTAGNFKTLFEQLYNDKKCSVVFEAMRTRLPDIILTADDFKTVLKTRNLTTEQRSAVFEAMRELLPNIIKTGYDFGTILDPLIPEQRSVVFEAMRTRLPDIILTADDFKTVLKTRNLTTEQRSVVFEDMQTLLPSIIKTADDFSAVLDALTTEQSRAVCDAMKTRLPNIIKTALDFWTVLSQLYYEKRSVVFEAMRTLLPNMIKTADDFQTVLYKLKPEQRSVVFEAVNINILFKNVKTKQNFFIELGKLNSDLTCSNILDLFQELRKPNGQYKYLHQQRHSGWDDFRLLFKSQRLQGEPEFWHTASYQKAVKLLKELYVVQKHNGSVINPSRQGEEDALIDYVRGNIPWHVKKTTTRNGFSNNN